MLSRVKNDAASSETLMLLLNRNISD